MNALQRLTQRFLGAVSSVPRAFEIGQRGRRLSAIPAVATAMNTLIMQYGVSSIARSRYLCTNNPYAMAAKETFVTHMVGGLGIRPSTLGETAEVKQQVHEDFQYWADQCDADGLTNLAGQQSQAASEWFEAGEVFAIMEERSGASALDDALVPLKIRLVPAEMLPYDMFSTAGMGSPDNYIQLGIEFNKLGERVAYHFLSTNPNDITRTDFREYKRVRVPAENVVHLFKPLRAGQVRGIPFTLAALVSTAMLDLYDDAELERKRVASLFAAFVTRLNPDDDHPLGKAKPANAGPGWVPSTEANNFTLQPGIVVDLLPGEDIKFSTPADSGGNYDPFEYRMLCRLAAGFGVPYASMTGDLRSANYGSIRAGLVQFRRRIESMQFQNFIPMLLRPIWLRWLKLYTFWGLSPWPAADWAVAKLRRMHQKVKWLCPRWEWVDPLKDMQAEKLAVDNGFKSRFDTVEETGADPDENDARILEAQESEDDNGLRLIRFTSGAAAGAEVSADPNLDSGGSTTAPQEKP